MRLKSLLVGLGLSLAVTSASANPSFWRNEWPNTDFTQTSVGWSEILSGGPPKDGIPALQDPEMIPIAMRTGSEAASR